MSYCQPAHTSVHHGRCNGGLTAFHTLRRTEPRMPDVRLTLGMYDPGKQGMTEKRCRLLLDQPSAMHVQSNVRPSENDGAPSRTLWCHSAVSDSVMNGSFH